MVNDQLNLGDSSQDGLTPKAAGDKFQGQGLQALIPPKKPEGEVLINPSATSVRHNQLEASINNKVNEAIANFPQELKESNNVSNSHILDSDKITNNNDLTFRHINNSEKQMLSSLTNDLGANEPLSDTPVLGGEIEEPDFAMPATEKIFYLETEKIKPNPYQPRKEFSQGAIEELAQSIQEFGILEPLIVSRIEKEVPTGTQVEYELIAGERRWRAAKFLGLPTVPAIIKQRLEHRQQLEIALIENIQREDLNIIAKARAFEQLITEFGLTQQALALRIGKSREVIANALRLLQLPYETIKYLEEGKLNEGHARAILLFESPEKRRAFTKEILAKNLSGREAWELAQHYLKSLTNQSETKTKRQKAIFDPQTLEIKEKLENFLATPVTIKKKGEKGAIELKFFSDEDLQKIIDKILNPNLN